MLGTEVAPMTVAEKLWVARNLGDKECIGTFLSA